MLSRASTVCVTAIGLAHDSDPPDRDPLGAAHCSSSAPMLDLAAAALDQTVRSTAVDLGEIELLVFGSDAFDGDRPPSAPPEERGPLLGNAFNDAVVRRLVLESGLTSAQPHGVFLAEGLAFCASLATARRFLLAEEDLRNIAIVTTHGRRPGSRHASACLVSREAQGGPGLVDVSVVTNLDGTRESEVTMPDFDLLYARSGHLRTSAAALIKRWWERAKGSATAQRGCALVECGADGLGLAQLVHPLASAGKSA